MNLVSLILTILLLFIRVVFYFINRWFRRFVLGQKLYKGDKLLSMGGIGVTRRWFKDDDTALMEFSNKDFVYRIYPYEIKLKPK